jgi:predicted DNA-binding transcriptional regulator AlpA
VPLAVARNQTTLADAQREHLDYLLKASGPLIGATVAGAVLQMRPQALRSIASKSGFPRRAAIIDGVTVWRRTDIEAYRLGKRDFAGDHDYLQDEVLASTDIALLVGLKQPRVWTYVHQERWDRVPPPAGNCGMKLYWFRADVDRWLPTRSVSGSPAAPKKRQKRP